MKIILMNLSALKTMTALPCPFSAFKTETFFLQYYRFEILLRGYSYGGFAVQCQWQTPSKELQYISSLELLFHKFPPHPSGHQKQSSGRWVSLLHSSFLTSYSLHMVVCICQCCFQFVLLSPSPAESTALVLTFVYPSSMKSLSVLFFRIPYGTC